MNNTSPAARPPARPAMGPLRPFTPEQQERIRAVIETLVSDIRSFIDALNTALRATAEAFQQMAAAIQHATLAAAHSTGRPGWVSPYGPAPRNAWVVVA